MTTKYFIYVVEGGYTAGRYSAVDFHGIADTIMDAKKMCCAYFNHSVESILDDESKTCYYDSWDIYGAVRCVEACQCDSEEEAMDVFDAEVIEVDGWYIHYEKAMGVSDDEGFVSDDPIMELHFEVHDYHNRGKEN